MTTTHNIVLVKDRRNPKEGYLKLRTITNRKPKDKSLGIKILTNNWNPDKGYVYSRQPQANLINKKLEQILLDVKQGKTVNSITSDVSTFLEFAQRIIDVVPSHSTKRSKNTALLKFKEYINECGKSDISFEEIDVFFVRAYYGWLINQSTVAISSANEYFTVFKYLVGQVEENGLHNYIQQPFRGLKRKKSTKKYTVLTDNELRKFLDQKPQSYLTKQVHSSFLFMMHSAGMRISDALLLQWKNFQKRGNSYYIQYTTKKTGFPMETKLTLDALFNLMPFIIDYDPTFPYKYRRLNIKSENLKKELKTLKSERESIILQPYARLIEEIEIFKNDPNEKDKTWEEIISREEKKRPEEIT